MTQNATDNLTLKQPIPEGGEVLLKAMTGLLDGTPKDESEVKTVLQGHAPLLEQVVAGLYSMASMLVGEGEASVRVVETAVAKTEVSPCGDAEEGRRNSRRTLCRAAIAVLAERDAASLAAPAGSAGPRTCIEDNELDAAGVSRAELERLMAGPGRERVRTWLESLPVLQRVVFVLRAVAGFTADESAVLLAEAGGPRAKGWSGEAVREVFRQAFCSLASQVIHAATTL